MKDFLPGYQYENPRQTLHPMNVNHSLPYSGKWEANNPDVWKIMEPGLRIATRLLLSAHALPYVS